jgi:Fe-S-cluster-containing hydrogenase component 2
MFRCLTTLGYLHPEDLEGRPGVPSPERRARGPVAVFECIQEIPCNPCEESCDQAAVRVGERITDCPVLVPEQCSGCGKCVSACPGQAVFIVDESRGDEARVTIPYEFLPLPEKGQRVIALDRSGAELGEAEIVRVRMGQTMDRTAQVTMAVPRQWAMTARFFKPKEQGA